LRESRSLSHHHFRSLTFAFVRSSSIGARSAHAWRRGWAVQALRNGVSETSARAAAGWTSGAMVYRYVNVLSDHLAITEFQRSWG
jgi:integrase